MTRNKLLRRKPSQRRSPLPPPPLKRLKGRKEKAVPKAVVTTQEVALQALLPGIKQRLMSLPARSVKTVPVAVVDVVEDADGAPAMLVLYMDVPTTSTVQLARRMSFALILCDGSN